MSTGEIRNREYHNEEKPMEDLLIPDYILNNEDVPARTSNGNIPKYPVLVFVNIKSGGQLGSQILPQFRAALNPKQVHELPKEEPGNVLRQFLTRLDNLKAAGDEVAAEIKQRLRLVVAGGDGTHGWILGCVADLKEDRMPPVATIPLGTGNNLPFSFGWGKKNPATTAHAIRELLQQSASAKPVPVDRWHVVIRMSKKVEDSPLKKLSSRHLSKIQHIGDLPSFQQVSDDNEIYESGRHSYQGGFWNYLTIGMDAQVSYEFHTQRQAHPEKFKNQIRNQSRYAALSCTQGWFCASCLHPRSKNINTLANIFYAKQHDKEWHKLNISPSIRSIILLNLPSFSGGLNPWGNPSPELEKKRHLHDPFVNDGKIEIVGFRDGWHGMTLLFPHGHGIRLAQAHRIKIEFHKGGVDHTFMRVDGEPWLQHLPSDDKPTVMEVTHNGQAVVLALNSAHSDPGESRSNKTPTIRVATPDGRGAQSSSRESS